MNTKPIFPETDLALEWCDAFEREHGGKIDERHLKRILYVWFCAHEDAVIEGYRRRSAPIIAWRVSNSFWGGALLGAALACGGLTLALLIVGAGQ